MGTGFTGGALPGFTNADGGDIAKRTVLGIAELPEVWSGRAQQGGAMSLANEKPVAFIITRDRKAAQAFYGGVLGLPFMFDDGFAAVYNLAGSPLRITELADHQPSPHPVLGWMVGDIVAMVTALKNRGVTFNIDQGMGQDDLGIWTAPGGAAKVAFFSDPDGNGLSLTEARSP